ncbi:MAG: hypothetical protein R3E88_04330 [Myxococcota bacterium]
MNASASSAARAATSPAAASGAASLALAVAIALAVGGPAGAETPLAASGGEAWMPVDVGLYKRFVHRQDRDYTTGGMSLGVDRMVGTREERVVAAGADAGDAAAEIRISTELRGDESQVSRETKRVFVSPTSSAYVVHGWDAVADGEQYRLRYPRPAVVLDEKAAVGKRWHVSSESVGGLAGETWGEVVGLQDARTPAGRFEKCLVVRYTGTVTGEIEIPGAGRMQVTDGEVVVTEWHARGIGLVLSQERLRETLVGEGGVELVASMESETSLAEWRREGAGARGPARAAD